MFESPFVADVFPPSAEYLPACGVVEIAVCAPLGVQPEKVPVSKPPLVMPPGGGGGGPVVVSDTESYSVYVGSPA